MLLFNVVECLLIRRLKLLISICCVLYVFLLKLLCILKLLMCRWVIQSAVCDFWSSLCLRWINTSLSSVCTWAFDCWWYLILSLLNLSSWVIATTWLGRGMIIFGIWIEVGGRRMIFDIWGNVEILSFTWTEVVIFIGLS